MADNKKTIGSIPLNLTKTQNQIDGAFKVPSPVNVYRPTRKTELTSNHL